MNLPGKMQQIDRSVRLETPWSKSQIDHCFVFLPRRAPAVRYRLSNVFVSDLLLSACGSAAGADGLPHKSMACAQVTDRRGGPPLHSFIHSAPPAVCGAGRVCMCWGGA